MSTHGRLCVSVGTYTLCFDMKHAVFTLKLLRCGCLLSCTHSFSFTSASFKSLFRSFQTERREQHPYNEAFMQESLPSLKKAHVVHRLDTSSASAFGWDSCLISESMSQLNADAAVGSNLCPASAFFRLPRKFSTRALLSGRCRACFSFLLFSFLPSQFGEGWGRGDFLPCRKIGHLTPCRGTPAKNFHGLLLFQNPKVDDVSEQCDKPIYES